MQHEMNTEDGPILLRKRRSEDAEMDITPMIDIVFLLLIFFLVCSTMGKDTQVQLPKARYGVAVNPRTSTVLSLVGGGKDVTVYLGDVAAERRFSSDREVQEAEIVQAVEKGLKEGKSDVMIRADRKLHHGEVVRVESIVTSVPGVSLYVIVDDR